MNRTMPNISTKRLYALSGEKQCQQKFLQNTKYMISALETSFIRIFQYLNYKVEKNTFPKTSPT